MCIRDRTHTPILLHIKSSSPISYSRLHERCCLEFIRYFIAIVRHSPLKFIIRSLERRTSLLLARLSGGQLLYFISVCKIFIRKICSLTLFLFPHHWQLLPPQQINTPVSYTHLDVYKRQLYIVMTLIKQI